LNAGFIFALDLSLSISQDIDTVTEFVLRQVGFVRYDFKL